MLDQKLLDIQTDTNTQITKAKQQEAEMKSTLEEKLLKIEKEHVTKEFHDATLENNVNKIKYELENKINEIISAHQLEIREIKSFHEKECNDINFHNEKEMNQLRNIHEKTISDHKEAYA